MGELSAPSGSREATALRDGLVAMLAWALLAVVVRLVWLRFHPPALAWDGAIYHRTAERIARGMGYVDTWNNLPPYRPTAFYPVGYPAALAAGYALAGPSVWVAGAINVASAAVSTGAAFSLARAAFGRGPSHLAAALFALSPGAVAYSSAFMTEPLSAALLALAVVAALHHARTGRAWSALAAGLLLGAGGLVRPPALLIAPVLALAATPAFRWRELARTMVLFGLATCAVVLPWTARNCRALDGCALVSVNGGSNLWIGADPHADGGYRDLRVGEGCDRVRGEVRKDRCYGELALARITRAPLAWVALAPAKVRQLLDYEAAPAAYLRDATRGQALGRAHEPFVRWMTAHHRLVLALALLCALPLGRRRTRAELVMAAVVLASVGVHVVFFGSDRYHFVFTPVLCALAGVAARRTSDEHARLAVA